MLAIENVRHWSQWNVEAITRISVADEEIRQALAMVRAGAAST